MRRTSVTLMLACLLATLATSCDSGGSEGAKTLTIAYWNYAEGTQNKKFFEKLKPIFEKQHPGWKVKLVAIQGSENEYYTKLSLMQRSPDTAPDLIYEDTFLINSDVTAGYLRPLDSYVKKWDDWDNYFDTAKQATRAKDGKIYGIPMNTDTRGLWYHKDVFEKAGLPVPWDPKSWDDVLDAARTIKREVPDAIPMHVYSGTPTGEAATMQGFEMLLYGTGDTLYNQQTDKWIAPSQGFVDSLDFIQTLYQNGLGPTQQQALDPNVGDRVAQQWLPNGKLGIALDGSWMPQNWTEDGTQPWPEWDEKLGWTAMPTQNGQDPGKVSLSGGWALSIGSGAEKPDMAWKFMQLALSKKWSLYYTKLTAAIAVRKDVANDPDYLKSRPDLKFWTDLVEYTYYRPAYAKYPRISTEIQTAMEAVMTGQASPQQATERYTQNVTSIVSPDQVTSGS